MNILLLTLSLFSLLKCIDCRSFSSFSEINKKLPTSRRKDRSFLDVFCNEIADEVSKYNVTNRGNMILGIALPWLYFLSVSINMPTFPKFVNWCINNGNSDVTPRSSKVFGRLSAFDSLFTFLSVNLVGCLSDRYGRKPFLMLSSLGLGFAYLIATFSRLPWQFYLAASIDGSTSSMFAQAQAYITDCCNDDSIDDVSEISAALGRFQGFAIGLAFVLGIPLGSLLAKKSLLLPLYTSIIICTFATVLIFFFLPESLQFHRNANNEIIRKNIDWKNANPFGAFHMLSTRGRNLVFCSIAYFFLNLSQCGAQIIWINYLQYRFGWPSEISGLAFVFVGLMVTVTPKFLINRFGRLRAISAGILFHSLAMAVIGFAYHPSIVIVGVVLLSIGASSLPMLLGHLTGQVKSDELGELQGAADTLRSIANILGSILMSHIFAHFISKERVLAIPGMTFFISSILSFLSVLVYQFTLHSQFYRDDMVSSEMKLVANELN